MTFDVAADSYTRFMGRFSEPLAERLVRLVGAHPGQRALDVGCGPGALTAPLVALLGAQAVAAVDPSESFVAATASRFPEVDVRPATAEALPFEDGDFDLTLAQLVVHFMRDPVAGLAEMARVTRAGGTVAASVWDHAGGAGPLTAFWDAVRDLDPDHPGEADLAGTREGHLAELFAAAGLRDVRPGTLTVTLEFATFDDWWSPFLLGVGPAGHHLAGLPSRGVEALRERCEERLPEAPFTLDAKAWCVTGTAWSPGRPQ